MCLADSKSESSTKAGGTDRNQTSEAELSSTVTANVQPQPQQGSEQQQTSDSAATTTTATAKAATTSPPSQKSSSVEATTSAFAVSSSPPGSSVAAAAAAGRQMMNFRINKIKKETQMAQSSSENDEAAGGTTTKSGSTSPTRAGGVREYVPRKKLEKLNYKVGASILEIYKERNKAKLDEAAIVSPIELFTKRMLFVNLLFLSSLC